MKILLLCAYNDKLPFIRELKLNLEKKGCTVDIFDTNRLELLSNISICRPGLIIRFFMRIPKIRHLLRPFFFRHVFRSLSHTYDLINIHYIGPLFFRFSALLKSKCRRLAATVWGSDLLRIGDDLKRRLRSFLDKCDAISVANDHLERILIDEFSFATDKIFQVRFGLSSLDAIADILSIRTKNDVKSELRFPADRIIVACGYNANRDQQHELMIDALLQLPENKKKRIFAVFQMTYPQNTDYVDMIAEKLKQSGIEFKVFSSMMNIDEIAKFRIATDVVINMQKTDALSASLIEHLYCREPLIYGNWLNYSLLAKAGCNLVDVGKDAESIARKLTDVIDGIIDRSDSPSLNTDVYKLVGWSYVINDWLRFYGFSS